MIQRNETFVNGLLVQAEIIDTTAQTVTYDPPIWSEDATPIQITERPFTTDEAIYWAGYEAGQIAQQNEATLRADPQQHIDIQIAAIDALVAIRQRTNSEINANPAAALKDALQEILTIARRGVRTDRIVLGALDSTDDGS